ncbi:MAG: DUF2283 domain-containing protein [Nodosilinea sp.]
MKIQFDSQADALYLRLLDSEVADSESLEPDVVYDYDAENRVVGVEVLRVRANLPNLATRALPFKSLGQQIEFLSFLETLADTDLQAKLVFAKQILQNQHLLSQSA